MRATGSDRTSETDRSKGRDGPVQPLTTKTRNLRNYAKALLLFSPILVLFVVRPFMVAHVWWPLTTTIFGILSAHHFWSVVDTIPEPYDRFVQWQHATRLKVARFALSFICVASLAFAISQQMVGLGFLVGWLLGNHIGQFLPARKWFNPTPEQEEGWRALVR